MARCLIKRKGIFCLFYNSECRMLCFFTTHCSLRFIVRTELEVPTFATRRLHACQHARSPSGGRWNCGREMSGNLGEKCPGILPKCRIPLYIQRYFTCRKATTWDRRLCFPSEGRRAEDFFALKIRRLRLGYQRPARYL
jgi:hypothetical protein